MRSRRSWVGMFMLSSEYFPISFDKRYFTLARTATMGWCPYITAHRSLSISVASHTCEVASYFSLSNSLLEGSIVVTTTIFGAFHFEYIICSPHIIDTFLHCYFFCIDSVVLLSGRWYHHAPTKSHAFGKYKKNTAEWHNYPAWRRACT